MQKLVIDTNVFVSYLISQNGFSFKIVDEVLLSRNAVHYVSNDTLKEYLVVFNRARFAKKYPEFLRIAYLLYDHLTELSVAIKPAETFEIIKDDSDNRFLEVADAVNANYLITGNKLHFTFASFYNTQIVSPKGYWENYKP